MVTAVFDKSTKYVTAERLWQWDYGQILRIQGLQLPQAVEIHFSKTENSGDSVTRIGVTKDGVTEVLIPDSMLESTGDIYAFVYLRTESVGETEYKVMIPLKERPRPEIPGTSEDGGIFEEILETVNTAMIETKKSEENALQHATDAQETAAKAEKASQEAEEHKNEAQRVAADAQKTEEQIQQTKSEIWQMHEDVSHQAGEVAADAQNVAEDREATEQYAAQTEENAKKTEMDARQTAQDRETVQQATEGFADAARKAVQEITDTGTAQTAAVNSAGVSQIAAIDSAGSVQLQNIRTAGTEEIEKVQQAAAEIVADRQQIGKNTSDIGRLQQEKADAIVETESGTLLDIKDSADARLIKLKIDKNVDWIKITGKNLLDAQGDKTGKNIESMEFGVGSIKYTLQDDYGGAYVKYSKVFDPGKYVITTKITNNANETLGFRCGFDKNITVNGNELIYNNYYRHYFMQDYAKKIELNSDEPFSVMFAVGTKDDVVGDVVEFAEMQIEKGEAATPYEPYCTEQIIESPVTDEKISTLHTNYPTTIISNSKDAHMEVSYAADTKNYIDKKFKELNQAIMNTQIALL